MTRSTLRRTLGWSYLILCLVLGIALVTRLAEHIPGLTGTREAKIAAAIYDYLKDMALVLITVVATYLAGVFQKRQSFIAALKEEWREIVQAKSALFAYTQIEEPTRDQYMAAFLSVSETIDNMRTVYGNVGETDELIGLYPFAPLHDMRRALQTLDPRNGVPTPDQRKLARDAILQSFYALRESFLDELDLEAPDRSILAWGARRHKKSGAPPWARELQDAERIENDRVTPPDARIDDFLRAHYEREHTTDKPWRQVAPGRGPTSLGANGGAAGSPQPSANGPQS